jgi:hypothetical protein
MEHGEIRFPINGQLLHFCLQKNVESASVAFYFQLDDPMKSLHMHTQRSKLAQVFRDKHHSGRDHSIAGGIHWIRTLHSQE